MTEKKLSALTILVKGAGEMATGIACRLYRANLKQMVMVETARPLAVRRTVAFCEAVYDDVAEVEGITAAKAQSPADINTVWKSGRIPVIVDAEWKILRRITFDVVIDAIVAKRNLGTTPAEANLVIGMGPGFRAGEDVRVVIETNRGHNLGRVLQSGEAEANTGVPGNIGGFTGQRVLRAPGDGPFLTDRTIGDRVKTGDPIGQVGAFTVTAPLEGVIRGLIRPGTDVWTGLKIGDIDPRGVREYCYTVSDKARALGGAVLEAILAHYNQP